MESVAGFFSHGFHRFHEETTVKAIFIRSGEPQDHGNLVVSRDLPIHHKDTKTQGILLMSGIFGRVDSRRDEELVV